MGDDLFDIKGRRVAITGGAGVLCGAISRGLCELGAKVAILDVRDEAGGELAEEINSSGGQAVAVHCNVLEKESIAAAADRCREEFGHIDVLINGAGGNKPEATCAPTKKFFDLPTDAMRWVFELNCMGTILAAQVFGRSMAERGDGTIINISSMNAFRPLTNIAAYSAAKAAVSNFTQWLAVYLARGHSPNIRVNAVAPGFFLTEQNRFLLTEEKTGELMPRGRTIVDHTPLGRLGKPEELAGTVAWLISDAAAFITGAVVPVDGGFNAFSGV